MVIHPSYVDALNLQNVVIGELEEGFELKISGIVTDLPGAIDIHEYHETLAALQEDLKTLPTGRPDAGRFEEIVGEIIKLCFFKSLYNVQQRVRDVDGRVIRDWIAANHASSGFWEMVRLRSVATQIVWECKNLNNSTPVLFIRLPTT